jgi:hypothetical protein
MVCLLLSFFKFYSGSLESSPRIRRSRLRRDKSARIRSGILKVITGSGEDESVALRDETNDRTWICSRISARRGKG